MSNGAPPTRLIVCVDGEANNSTAPGKLQPRQPTLTSIQRINAGITRGNCTNTETGLTYNQVVQYVPGLGASDEPFSNISMERLVGGNSHLKQIQEVYESCSRLNGSRDEVWLFGFSRGAYVVRAVAGLLHTFGALASAGEPNFATDFKRLLKEAERHSGSSSLALSPVSTLKSGSTRPAPAIKFVGAFETIKAVGDDAPFDLTYNNSCQHMRHALSLHEDRKALTPEYLYPEQLYRTRLSDADRSFVQAYFVGNHNDMGGSVKKLGLSLYPLQWMLLEARKCGLFLTCFDGGLGEATLGGGDPLAVVFPKASNKGDKEGIWANTVANGIEITMQDLREVHELARPNQEDYGVKLNTNKLVSLRRKEARDIFEENGMLRGYCDWAPQGTIIHPSAYLLIDEHTSIALETKEVKLQRHIENWRERTLGSNRFGLLNEHWQDQLGDDSPNPGAIRILVCGNTGVGKSTLINKTFGVEATQTMNRSRGIHDCREEIRFEGRPDLILHDSGGFEAGADEEFLAIESFLKEKSNAVDVMDRLHVIWFCVDINSPRTLQTATEKLFKAVSLYANEVPIVVVATKKDDLLDIEFGACRKQMKKEGKRFDEEACEKYAEDRLEERIETIRREMQTVEGGRLDACVAVSQDDDESIKDLSKTTSRCFDTDKVRLLYVRAQVSRIDLKVDLAVTELIRRYKKVIRSTTGSTFAAGGSTINKNVASNNVCKAIINCFGLPSVSATAALDALKASVWNHLGTNVGLAMADAFQAFGVTGSVFAMGIPVWAITGAISTPYVVPATCRLFLIMACDLTFVLARSFKEVTFRAGGQPNEKDVAAAARIYKLRGYSKHVHTHVKALVPRRNITKAYKVQTIRRGIESMVEEYKDQLMEDVDLPVLVKSLSIRSGSSGVDSETTSILSATTTEADSSLADDIADTKKWQQQSRNSNSSAGGWSAEDFGDKKGAWDARSGVAEVDGAMPLVELDASTPVAELPAEIEKGRLEDVSKAKTPHELAA